jgi:hypothetical protein
MATLLVIEDVPTLAQPTRDECGAGHTKAKNALLQTSGFALLRGLFGWLAAAIFTLRES